MHLYCQWTTDPPQSWTRYASVEAFNAVAAKPVPREGHAQGKMLETIDDTLGWVHALCVQGVSFTEYDHYCVSEAESMSNSSIIRVVVWNDDAEDWVDERMAIEIVFLPPALDERGVMNTRQFRTHWSTAGRRDKWTKGGKVRFDFPWHDWEKFVPPDGKVFHGIWTNHDLNRQLGLLRDLDPHPWMEWVE